MSARSTGRRATWRAVVLAGCVAVATSGCVSSQPRSSAPPTSVLAPVSFCAPIASLSTTAWTDTGSRAVAVADLEAARASAPENLHATLDELIALEAAGVRSGAPMVEAPIAEAPAGGDPVADDPAAGDPAAGDPAAGDPAWGPGLDRWFDAMNVLAEVAARECGVDLAAGAGAPPGDALAGPAPSTSTGASSTGAAPVGSVPVTPDDVVALARAGRPGPRWASPPTIASVSSGDVVQVTVVDVDDPAVALAICDDLLAVLPDQSLPPMVTVRATTGFVLVAGESGVCTPVAHP